MFVLHKPKGLTAKVNTKDTLPSALKKKKLSLSLFGRVPEAKWFISGVWMFEGRNQQTISVRGCTKSGAYKITMQCERGSTELGDI